MPTLTGYVRTLYSLFDHFAQAKARTETPKQGPPFTYADKGLILFFLLRHARAIDRFKAQRRWRKAHAEMLPLLHFEAVPHRTTLSRRYNASTRPCSIDEGEVVARRLVIARGDTTVVLQAVEKPLAPLSSRGQACCDPCKDCGLSPFVLCHYNETESTRMFMPGRKPQKSQEMNTARRFSDPVLQALRAAKILGIRAGSEHRYTGVWVVVVEGRVFVRSWNDKPTGWYRAFRNEPRGSIQVAGREVAVRARHTRSERLREAVSRAYAEKYNTKASEKWVRGFAEAHRTRTTLELVPVSKGLSGNNRVIHTWPSGRIV